MLTNPPVPYDINLVGSFNQENDLVGALPAIVKPDVSFAALV